MGLLNLFSRSRPTVLRLPTGSFTVDRDGRIITATVPSSYPAEVLQEIADHVLTLFREARGVQLALAELTIHFASLQITARELRGGAIVFLSPRTLSRQPEHLP